MPLGVLARLEPGACAQKRRVRHLRARGRGDRPAYRHAIEAADYRGEVGLSGGDAELRDVRYPELVGRTRPEVVLPAPVSQQVARRFGNLPPAGAVAPPPLGGAGDEGLLAHDRAHGPLPDARLGGDPPMAVGAAAVAERPDCYR